MSERIGIHRGERVAYPPGKTVVDFIAEQALATPSAVAIEFEGAQVSYADAIARANRLAQHLIDQGIERGDAVGVCMHRCEDLVVSLLAVVTAGACYVPLDPEYPPFRLDAILRDAGISKVIANAQSSRRLPDVSGIECIDIDEQASVISAKSGQRPRVELDGDDLAYIIFTSGSTGRPKGVMLPHAGLANRLCWMQQAFPIGGEDVLIQKTAFTFDVSVWEFFWPLMYGAKLVVARPDGHKDPGYLAELIQSAGVTVIHFVPSMLRLFLSVPEAAKCSSLRRVICSGEALTAAHRDEFFETLGAELHNLYGPTEASIDVTWWQCRPEDTAMTVPIGKPVANTDLYVVDADRRPVIGATQGELFIAGVQLARGYCRRPDLTAERFIPDPTAGPGRRMYWTGDLASSDEDGAIVFLGRVDHQVKLRGFRIELGEIEAVLLRSPFGIRTAAVVVQSFGSGDSRLVAHISGMAKDMLGQLREYLEGKLPDYMVPSAFVVLGEMPLTQSGKIDRRMLPDFNKEVLATQAPYIEPRTEYEKAIAELWSSMLKVPNVGRDDRFFALGGHSILATQVVTRLIDQFGVALPVRVFLRSPTVAEAAIALEVALDDPLLHRSKQMASIPARPDSEKAPLMPKQEAIWGHELMMREFEGRQAGYIEVPVYHLRGSVRRDLIERALNELARRLDLWRTSFVEDGGEVVQKIARTARIPMRYYERPCSDAAAVKEELTEIAKTLAANGFDLSKGPLVRCALVKTGDAQFSLVLVTHHLITDAWSETLVARELARLYRLLESRDPIPPYSEAPQYADYAAWYVAEQNQESLSRAQSYWRGMFEQRVAPLTWEKSSSPSPDRVTRILSPETTKALHNWCKRHNLSVATVIYAAFGEALTKYADSSRLLMGVANANRNPTTEGIVGLFAGPLPIILDFNDQPDIESMATAITQQLGQSLTHVDLPLIEISRLAATPRGKPFIQVQVSTQVTEDPIEIGDVVVEQDFLVINEAKFDLELVVQEGGEDDALGMTWLPHPEAIDGEHLRELIAAVEKSLTDLVTSS